MPYACDAEDGNAAVIVILDPTSGQSLAACPEHALDMLLGAATNFGLALGDPASGPAAAPEAPAEASNGSAAANGSERPKSGPKRRTAAPEAAGEAEEPAPSAVEPG